MDQATAKIDRATTARIVSIPPDMTIYTAQERKHELLAALTEAEQLTLDLTHVEGIDLAGLQLLILLKREAAGQGKTMQLVGHSQVVVKLIDFCNLTGFFGDPVLLTQAAA